MNLSSWDMPFWTAMPILKRSRQVGLLGKIIGLWQSSYDYACYWMSGNQQCSLMSDSNVGLGILWIPPASESRLAYPTAGTAEGGEARFKTRFVSRETNAQKVHPSQLLVQGKGKMGWKIKKDQSKVFTWRSSAISSSGRRSSTGLKIKICWSESMSFSQCEIKDSPKEDLVRYLAKNAQSRCVWILLEVWDCPPNHLGVRPEKVGLNQEWKFVK